MSVREHIELYEGVDDERYPHTLTVEYGAVRHPDEGRAYLVEGLPFHASRFVQDHLSILSFNNLPLPDALLEALVLHPVLFPDGVLVRWTQEQDLIYAAMLGYGTGLALVTTNWVFVFLTIIMVITGLLGRVPKEEKMMIEESGEEYRLYMQRTGRFFPDLESMIKEIRERLEF